MSMTSIHAGAIEGNPLERVLARLDAPKRQGAGWMARCPAHNDGRPSLSIGEGDDGRALLKCFAGCELEDILAAIDLRPQALFPDYNPEPTGAPRLRTGPAALEATYQYVNEHGEVVFCVDRLRHADGRKTFRQWHEKDGRRVNSLQGVARVLYRLPDILAGQPGDPADTVILVEGEKDADRLAAHNLIATTSAGGANAPWLEGYTDALAGRCVAIIPDNDDAGRKHAHKVATALHGRVASLKVIELEGLAEKGDVSDWLDAGHTVEELAILIDDAPEWQPQPDAPEAEPSPASRLIVTSLADVTPKPIEWIWHKWLARGEIHVLGAHAGVGKSTLTLALAAALSRGQALPDGTPAPRVMRTALAMGEDSLEHTVVPRLIAHGADLSQIVSVGHVADENGPRSLDIRKHIAELKCEVVRQGIDVLILDPISGYMPKTDRNSEGDVRDALMPLRQMAEETGVAVIGIMHTGKPSGVAKTPLQMLLGSTGFGAVARVVWMTAEIPDDAQPDDADVTGRRRVLEVVKTNLAMPPAPLLWSRPEDRPIEWHGVSSIGIAQAFQNGSGKPATARTDAKTWLETVLAGGGKPAAAIFELAKERGHSEKTIRRAKDELGIESVPVRERGRIVQNLWKLPDGSPRIKTTGR